MGADALFLAHRFQYFLAGGIAFSASRKIGAPLWTWYWFIGTFAFGKIIWEIEQYRYREGTCPTSALNPVYWFHAGWHVFAATCGVLFLASVAAMAYGVRESAAHTPSTRLIAHAGGRAPRRDALPRRALGRDATEEESISCMLLDTVGRGYAQTTPTRSCPAACWSRRRGRRRSAAAPL